jgi:hypothetical protein
MGFAVVAALSCGFFSYASAQESLPKTGQQGETSGAAPLPPPPGSPVNSTANLRYLLYLYARVGDAKTATAIAKQLGASQDRLTLLALAALYLEHRDADRLDAVTRGLEQIDPMGRETRYYRAAYFQLLRRHNMAREVLLGIRQSLPPNESFDYLTDLADAAAQSGDWPLALRTYRQILEENRGGEEFRGRIRKVLDRLYLEHLPQATAEVEALSLDSAAWTQFRVAGDAPSSLRSRISGELIWREVELETAPGIAGGSYGIVEGVASWKLRLDSDRWIFSLSLGGHQDGPIAGFTARRLFINGAEIGMAADWGERSEDSLAAEALNARQHRIHFPMVAPEILGFRLKVDPSLRMVEIGGETMGDGWSIDFQLDRTWVQLPELTVTGGYRGSYASFSPRDVQTSVVDPIYAPPPPAPTVADEEVPVATEEDTIEADRAAFQRGLIAEEFHRHGLGGELEWRASQRLTLRLNAGIDYLMDTSTWERSFGTGFSVWPEKNLEIRGSANYSSSAGALGVDTELLRGMLQLNYYF